jgi:hypothetical protein
MDGPGDYRIEMERLSSHEADRILSGDRPTTGAGRTASALVDALRAELLVVQDPDVARRHLGAMRAAAVPTTRNQGVIPMRVRARKRLASLALAASLILGAGIAGALTLPEQASDVAGERVFDVEPNGPKPGNGDDEGSSSDVSSAHGKAVSAVAHDDSTKGCEHGRAVSAVASSKAADNRGNDGDHRGACGPSEKSNGNHAAGNNGNHGLANDGSNGNHGTGNNGKGRDPQGQAGSAGGGSSAAGNGKSAAPHGQETAPGQSKHEISEIGEVPDLFPPGA